MALLNLFFHFLHIAVITFILIGWVFKRTRKFHLAVVLLTIFSWIFLGYFYGWGYCFITDWHWNVRERIGLHHPASYIKLLVDNVTGRSWNAAGIDLWTAILFTFIVALTLWINFGPERQAS